MAISEFIKDQIASRVLFDGTFGIEVETECKDNYKVPAFSFWDSKPDGSLRDVGMEYILRVPLKYGKELDDALEEFKTKLKDVKFIQDSNSTSVHIHINMLPETWQTLANFLTVYSLAENIFMEVAGETRRNNLFCLPLRSVPFVVDIIRDMFAFIEKKNYNIEKLLGNIHNNQWDKIKYAALNLGCLTRFGSIEIRSFRGVTDTEIIHAWVTIFQQLLEYSRKDQTPNQIMDQFQKKGVLLFEDIFGKEWHPYENIEQLIEPGPWFAGEIAYQFNTDTWKTLDVKVEKKEKPPAKRRSRITLDKIANDFFGCFYDELNDGQVEIIHEEYDRRQVAKKNMFINQVVFNQPNEEEPE